MAVVTSCPLTATVGASGSVLMASSASWASRATAGLVGAVEPLVQHQPGDRLIHRAGVEERQVEPAWATPRAVLDFPRAARLVDSDDERLRTVADHLACLPLRHALTGAHEAPWRTNVVADGQTTLQPRLVIRWARSSARSGATDNARYPTWRTWSCSIEMSSTLTPAAPTSENSDPVQGCRESPPPPGYTRPGGPHACREFSASPLPLVLGVREVIPTLGPASIALIMAASSSRT